MSGETRDFYYSENAFRLFKLDNPFGDEVVGEVLINGEWKPFTEQIAKGKKSLSIWEDLVFLGSSDTARYTEADEWIKERQFK